MVKGFHCRKFEKRDRLNKELHFDVTILPLRKDIKDNISWQGLGGAIDSDGNYIESSRIEKIIERGYNPDSTDYMDMTVVYCGYFRQHWGEFIAYCLPRLWYVLEKDTDVDKYVFFIEENEHFELSGNYRQLIERLGILNKVELISRPTTYKKVIIPEISYIQSEYYSKQYIELFNLINSNVEHINIEKSRKVFFTRSQLKKSEDMEAGVDMLDSFFENNGYKVISPENVTLDEMILYLDNADTIACISGTLPHNLLFAKDQTKSKQLIIVERSALFNFFQPDTDKMLNCNITYIDANISLYPVKLSYGPFLFAWNDYLKRFAEDNNMVPPDDCYLTEENKQAMLRKYMRAYRMEYHKCLWMPVWMQKYVDVIFEAYYDGELFFNDYLNEKLPYKRSQRPPFSYIIRLIRKLLME